MGTVTTFFLGANGAGGDYRLFHQLTKQESLRDLIILKGCPGGGTSVFIQRIGAALESAGADVEYIRCSGDPNALDGVFFPELRCGVVNGSAPHSLEPVYPLAVHRCVELGRFCDIAAAKASAAEIMGYICAAGAADIRAGHALAAAAQMEAAMRESVLDKLDVGKLTRRFAGITARELKRRGQQRGEVRQRLLGGLTAEGAVWCFDSVAALCQRIYVVEDSFGLASGELEKLCGAAAAKGWDVIACPSPAEPKRVEHILIPGLGLGFVTSCAGMRYPGTSYRRIRVDAMAPQERRGKLRLERKLAASLREEAVSSLQEAREIRRKLDAIYQPYVDFDGIAALADVEASRLLSWME